MAGLRATFRRIAQTWRDVYGNVFFLWLRLHFRAEFRQAASLADRLEDDIFGELLDTGRCQLLLTIPESNDALVLAGDAGKTDRPFTGTNLLAGAMANIGIRSILLDTRLTSEQTIQAVLLVLYAGAGLETESGDSARPSRRIRRLAKELVSDDALRRFSMHIRAIPEMQLLEIEYVYTEKLSTRLVDAWLRLGHSKDHRTLSKAAPKIGLAAALVVMVDLLLWTYHPRWGLWFGFAAAVLLGGVVTYLLYMLSSVQYDREHRDTLLKDSLREITDLSHFPLRNPNPNLKLGAQGELLYANPAAEALLRNLSLPPDAVKEILPEDFLQRVTAALDTEGVSEDVEVQSRGRTLHWRFSRFPKQRAVLINGVDVTPLKQLELELRDMNETLEQRVQERTLELLLTQDVTIMSLSTLAESRDPDTGAHLERTRNYVRALAEALKEHPRFHELLSQPGVIDQLYRSAPLHDIGKVGTRDAILLKNGRLDEDEYEVMKQHAMIGGDTLRWAEARLGTNSFLQFAREIAYYHHEKWDGSGYPFGLKGEEIPVSARLMAVADVYDALRSERCYKKALSHEEARDLIAGGTGSHFDPAVVEAFLNIEDQFIAIAEEFADTNKE
jgi:response regulator RpfG family c-di-GMP phosphodiesterase